MVVEVDDQHAVTWTRPDDLAFDPKDPKKGIGSLYEGGFNASFCDGSVHFLKASIDPKTLAALFTRRRWRGDRTVSTRGLALGPRFIQNGNASKLNRSA